MAESGAYLEVFFDLNCTHSEEMKVASVQTKEELNSKQQQSVYEVIVDCLPTVELPSLSRSGADGPRHLVEAVSIWSTLRTLSLPFFILL